MKIIFITLITIHLTQTTILSKSQLNHCYVDSQEDCQQKILLNLTVENSQKKNSEKIEFILNEIIDQDEQQVQLEQPLTLTISQNQVKVFYKLIYRRHFSEQVFEKIISSVYPFCSEGVLKDDQIMSDSTCGFVKDSNEKPILNSQGFCCSCPIITIITGLETEHHRGNCGFFDQTDTAHCLVFSNELYAGYQIEQYYYEYDIDVSITYQDDQDQQPKTITETLGYNNRIKSNQFFVAKIIGNFMPSQKPIDLQDKILLVPSFVQKNDLNENSQIDEDFKQNLSTEQSIKSFMDKSLIVNDNQISWDGQQCDKIGVSYNAFHNQNNKCESNAGSCLNNQIKDLYINDIKKIRNNQEPLYLLNNKGNFENIIQNESGVQLKMKFNHIFTTQITIEVEASDMKFKTYLGIAQIISASIEDVYSEQQYGILKAQIQNISNYSSSFEIQLSCSEFIEKVSSNKVSLESKGIENITIQFQVLSQQQQEHFCELNILNQKGEVVASEKIIFQGLFKEINIQDDVTIEDQEQQKVIYDDSSSQSDSKLKYDDLNKEIICQYLCPDMTGLSCFIINTCIDELKRILLIIGLILLASILSILIFIKFCGNQLLDFFIKLGCFKNKNNSNKDIHFQQVDIEKKVLPSQQYIETEPKQYNCNIKKRFSLSQQTQNNINEIKLSKSQQEISLPDDLEVHYYKLNREMLQKFYDFELKENTILQFILHKEGQIKYYEKNENLQDIMKQINIKKSEDYSCFWYELIGNDVLMKIQVN